MKIYEVSDKRKYMPLLLLADEQQSMVEKYLDKCAMFVLDDGGVKGEISVCEFSGGVIEIKNLAVYPRFQKMGYGAKLIDFVCREYRDRYTLIKLGTGDSDFTIPFYEKCGFLKSYTVKNFFTDNYDHPIIENGKQLIDMVYLERKL